MTRPFYPRSSTKGGSQADLLAAHGVKSMNELLRACERKTSSRRAACSLFWTLGGNQVGKAAINGWTGVVRPALARGARLWPFDGELGELSKSSCCVVCETYPGEAYAHVGVRFRPGESKRIQDDRRKAAVPIMSWVETFGVALEPEARENLLNGFGESSSGEDAFDALVGLLSMIEVADGRRPEGSAPDKDAALWEGWILGQRSLERPLQLYAF